MQKKRSRWVALSLCAGVTTLTIIFYKHYQNLKQNELASRSLDKTHFLYVQALRDGTTLVSSFNLGKSKEPSSLARCFMGTGKNCDQFSQKNQNILENKYHELNSKLNLKGKKDCQFSNDSFLTKFKSNLCFFERTTAYTLTCHNNSCSQLNLFVETWKINEPQERRISQFTISPEVITKKAFTRALRPFTR
jgi:hypothetical protein